MPYYKVERYYSDLRCKTWIVEAENEILAGYPESTSTIRDKIVSDVSVKTLGTDDVEVSCISDVEGATLLKDIPRENV